MSQAWSHVSLNLRHNSFQTKGRLVWMVDQNGSKIERFQNFFKKCTLSKSIFFCRSSFQWYIEAVEKTKKSLDVMGTLMALNHCLVSSVNETVIAASLNYGSCIHIYSLSTLRIKLLYCCFYSLFNKRGWQCIKVYAFS